MKEMRYFGVHARLSRTYGVQFGFECCFEVVPKWCRRRGEHACNIFVPAWFFVRQEKAFSGFGGRVSVSGIGVAPVALPKLVVGTENPMSGTHLNILDFKNPSIRTLHLSWVAFFITFVVWH